MKAKKGKLAIIDADCFLFYAGYHYRDSLNMLGELGAKDRVDNMLTRLLDNLQVTHYIGFFGMHGSENFRHRFATIKPYKGQRDSPAWQEFFKPKIKNHYADKWGFYGVKDIEADDAVTIAFHQLKNDYDIVMIGEDKDANQLGEFIQWNPRTKKLIKHKQENGRKFFWGQCLTGDSTDNIPGVRGIGEGDKNHPDLTKEMVERGEISRNPDMITLWELENPTEDDMFQHVKRVYQRVYGEEWLYHLVENYTLLRMLDKPCFDYPISAEPTAWKQVKSASPKQLIKL